ncbi:MAG: peptidylprolyl isomerase [Planctomycetota bacterium]|nr:peptidylprolyl isomerase [Planctomycetota bacterium]
MRAALCLLCVLCLAGLTAAPVDADTLDDRAKILRAEMTRDAAALHPFLKKDAAPALRRLALRALGRIGNDGTGPGILRDILATATPENEPELALIFWSAGMVQTKELLEPIGQALQRLREDKHFELRAAGMEALGRTPGVAEEKNALGALALMAEDKHPGVRRAALEALARAGAKERDHLAVAAASIVDPDAGVRDAAAYACWLIAGRYARAQRQADKAWDGDADLAKPFRALLQDEAPDRRMAGIRVLGSLLPRASLAEGGLPEDLLRLLEDPDPRVTQDAIGRILAPRQGEAIDAALVRALKHADPKVRDLTAGILGDRDHDGAVVRYALWQALESEADPRVRETLTVALVKHGAEKAWTYLAKAKDRHDDRVVRQTTEALVLLHSKRKEALDELFVWADPGASQRAGNLHAAVWMTILRGLEGKEHPKLDEWLMGFLAGGYAVEKPDRHFVIASAVALVGANKRMTHADTLLAMLKRTHKGERPHDEIKESGLHEEIRSALMGAFADLAGDEACPPETKKAMLYALGTHLGKDPSPWVRRAAWAAFEKLKEEPPEGPYGGDDDQSNAWKGVPRAIEPPFKAMPDPAGEGELLDERGILEIADWIAEANPRIVFETTAGPITVTLDARVAPVHCVSLLNAVANGVYTDTRFHRVVPNFVIQGGDPHGHGAGNGGWTVPDELSPKRYVRGALGMPKSTKDDGGCQIFIMHTTYRPLDERYTCYGNVETGMDAVDRIRVGDRITSARVVLVK